MCASFVVHMFVYCSRCLHVLFYYVYVLLLCSCLGAAVFALFVVIVSLICCCHGIASFVGCNCCYLLCVLSFFILLFLCYCEFVVLTYSCYVLFVIVALIRCFYFLVHLLFFVHLLCLFSFLFVVPFLHRPLACQIFTNPSCRCGGRPIDALHCKRQHPCASYTAPLQAQHKNGSFAPVRAGTTPFATATCASHPACQTDKHEWHISKSIKL